MRSNRAGPTLNQKKDTKMPIRVRWISKEYFGIGLLLLGLCGSLQLLFIFMGQYVLGIGNYFIVVLIPLGITLAIFFSSIIIYESYAEVERREKLRSQFRKSKTSESIIRKFLDFPITKPILITFVTFTAFFFIAFYVCIIFLNNALSFLFAENISAIICLLIANLIEKNYARIQKY
ncbi:MAG: hypothetical protein ACFFFB_17000 [Candidatus Heimdallarchaeota archaeon]